MDNGNTRLSLVSILFIAILTIVILFLGGIYFFARNQESSMFDRSEQANQKGSEMYLGAQQGYINPQTLMKKVELYFVNEQTGELLPESREIRQNMDPISEVRETIIEFLKGSKMPSFIGAPAQTKLREVYIDIFQTVYIDLTAEFVNNHPAGVDEEIKTVIAFIKTIHTNFPQISGIQFLVEGKEVKTLNGHLRLDRPLKSSDFVWYDDK